MARSRVVQTPRGWGLLAGGLVSLGIGLVAINLLLLLVGVVVLAFVGIDLLSFALSTRDFRPDDFTVQRTENTALLPVGAVGTMALRVGSQRKGGMYAEVYDRVPEGLAPIAGSPHLVTWWERGSDVSLAYAYRAELRGTLEIGPTIVVAHDTFGLAFRGARVENRWPVEVIPQVALWRTEITERLRNETVGRVLTGPRGFGTEFRSLREYQDRDDFRSIVWKRSTFERLLVKETQIENRVDVALLLDVSRPMGEGRPGGEALDLAVEASLLLARYAFSQGDRTAALLYSDLPAAFLPLDRSTDHSFQLDRLIGQAKILTGLFQLEDALRYLAERLGQATSVFAFTALDPVPDLSRGGLAAFRRAGHRLYVYAPDPQGLFPPGDDALANRAVRVTAGPDVARRREAVARLRAQGLPVSTYSALDLLDQVTQQYVRLRVGGGT